MQSFDCLVIVYSDPAVFALQVGQLDVVVRCRLIYFHDFHRFVEKGGKDELGFIISSRILKEPLKLDVLEFVQTATKNDAVIKLMKEEFQSIEVVRGGSVGIESISMMER